VSDSLAALIHAAKKVFVWVQFSEYQGAFIQVTKRALFDFLEESDKPIELSPWMSLEDGELYLGRVGSATHISCSICNGERWITDNDGEIQQCSCA